MLNKSITFSLLALTLTLAPTIGFAQQRPSNTQTSITRSRRVQKSITGRYRNKYRCTSTKTNQQSQDIRQTSVQEGVAENISTNTQNTSTVSNQVQRARIRNRILCR